MRRSVWTAVSLLGMFAASAAEASCPAKPSAPVCLNKKTPFAPAEQVECVGKAQRYFALSDKYLACLRNDAARAEEEAAEARSRLACRSTTKRPC